jgi:hypothetical protein
VIGAGLALAALVTAAAASPVAAHEARGIFNTRYCEVLELRGTPPDALVTVWNTIGLSDCPQDQWQALDAGALAAARGDTAVLLNGPRYWLMDSAAGKPGPSDVFGGLRMRQVATIPIHSAAELAQTPYIEHTIVRRNAWTWMRGRTVYELLAPGGARYVMQSYSQIRDPSLTLSALPGLGGRLALPEGWRFRVRRLRQNLVLAAHGSATVIQDELMNTYQRE